MARRSPRTARSTPEPIRATSMWRVDQVFLKQSGVRIEVITSLVNDREGLRNLSMVASTEDVVLAVRQAARFVAGRGNVSGARNARVRWAREQATTPQDNLVRDLRLEDEFLDAFEETLQEIRDQMR